MDCNQRDYALRAFIAGHVFYYDFQCNLKTQFTDVFQAKS